MFSGFKLYLTNKLPLKFQLVSLHVRINKMTSRFSIVKLTGKDDNDAIHIAVKVLEQGGIIALPTDTIYGLAVDATNSTAIHSLYQIKQRDLQKPLSISVDKVSEVKKWGVTDNLPDGLLSKLLPGPVTVLLNRTSVLNFDLNPGVMQVGLRVPGSSFVCSIASMLGKPLALTSANPSSQPSCISVNEFKVLWPLVEVIFDGGTIDNDSRDGSTIVDLSVKGKYKIIRSGIGLKSVTNLLHRHGLNE